MDSLNSEGDDDNMKRDGHSSTVCVDMCVPHVSQAVHSIFSDILVRVVEV